MTRLFDRLIAFSRRTFGSVLHEIVFILFGLFMIFGGAYGLARHVNDVSMPVAFRLFLAVLWFLAISMGVSLTRRSVRDLLHALGRTSRPSL